MKLNILYEKLFLILDACSNLTEGACAEPEVLKVLMFVKELLKILFFIVPIGLIVMLAMDLIKNVMASKEDEQKKNVQLAIKRMIFCVAIFFVPTIVNVVNSLLIEVGVGTSFTCCLENANSEYIETRTEKIAYELYEKAKIAVAEIDPNSNKKVYKNAVNKANGAILEFESYIYKVKNETKKTDLEGKVESLRREIVEKNTKDKDKNNNNNSTNNSSSNNKAETTEKTSGTKEENHWYDNKDVTKVIYIGDSRTVGMCNANTLSDKEICVAKEGVGYPWLSNNPASAQLKIYPTSYVVINMGTNSGLTTSEAKSYATYYNNLSTKYPNIKIIVVSVTQIDFTKAKNAGMYKNVSVDTNTLKNFNSTLKANLNSNVSYCDVYSKMANYNYSASDGVHYNKDTYKFIYNEIQKCIK